MFGYVRPVRDELKCKDFNLYRSTYCGLCRTLRRRYGLLAPMILNFDFTFLALLLAPPEARFTPCRGRCHANPLRRLPMCPESQALDTAADESVILTYWKLRDSVRDDGFWGGLPARLLSWLLLPAFRKAAGRRPGFEETVVRCLTELAGLEKEGCSSIDRAADAFARLLRAAAPPAGDPARDRPVELLLYHLGRWIYLIESPDSAVRPPGRRSGPGRDPGALPEHGPLRLLHFGAGLPDCGGRKYSLSRPPHGPARCL